MSSPYERPSGGGWRYTPPPAWPAPPAGWEPWAGWRPPPQWPEPPEGWAFWVRERAWPARHPWWTGAAAAFAIVLTLGVTGAAVGPPPEADAAVVGASPSTSPSASPSASPSVVASAVSPTASPTPSPTPAVTSPTSSPAPAAVPRAPVAVPYYANCAAVRAAGKAPLSAGQPGYRAGLDGDSDGVACEATSAPRTTRAPVPVPPRTTPAPAPPRTTAAPAPDPDPPAPAYYANCTEAWNAGAAPLHRGEPGYRSGLDRDGDGTACEKRP